MKKTFFKIGAFVLLFALMGTGCEKEENDYDPNSIIGKWKWIYTYGGIVGTTYPREGQTIIWTFTEDSILIVPETWGTAINTKFHVSEDTLKYFESIEIIYQFQIKGDTLNLLPVSMGPSSHFFKRIN
jgi:hypothetical protein